METYVDGNFSGIDNLNNYSSYTWDETLGLYFAQNRFYDASEHRFTQEDPAKSGGNWYSYCDGNPLTRVDVWGLKAAGEIVPWNGSKLDVILVQWQLDKLGYKGANGKPLYNGDYMMDGIWGPNTEFAVKTFQREHGLTVDGLVGDVTWKALGLSLTTPVMQDMPRPSSNTTTTPSVDYRNYFPSTGAATPNVNAPEQIQDYFPDLACPYLPGLGSVKYNAADGYEVKLSAGWVYRYEKDPQPHMHIYKLNNSEDYSQNEDGSHHHDPKGGNGPPNWAKKEVKEKTGWDWKKNEQNNASKAVVTKGDVDLVRSWKITYSDGYVYSMQEHFIGMMFVTIPEMPNTLDEIAGYYYKAGKYDSPSSNIGSGNNLIFPIIEPVPVPPLPFPAPIPMPIPAW